MEIYAIKCATVIIVGALMILLAACFSRVKHLLTPQRSRREAGDYLLPYVALAVFGLTMVLVGTIESP